MWPLHGYENAVSTIPVNFSVSWESHNWLRGVLFHFFRVHFFCGGGGDFVFFNINLFILIGGWLLYNIVLVLPYINMNLPQVYMCSPSWTLFPPPSPYHPSGSSQCTSPKHPIITWTDDSFHIWYYTCFNAFLPNHPTLSLSHRVQKTVLYICVSFAVSHTGLSLPSL